MFAYCAFENDNLVALESSPFIDSYSMDVSGEAYTSAKTMFDAGFVHNALLVLIFGCNKRLPNGKDIASAHRKAEKYALNPVTARVRRKDGMIVNVYDQLDYKETQLLMKDRSHVLYAVYCLEDVASDLYGQNYLDAFDRNDVLGIAL